MMSKKSTQRYRAAEATLWNHYGLHPEMEYLHLDRHRLRVRLQVIGEGAPLLFLHGNPNASTTWAPLVATLTSFRCLLLDLPGHGLSDPVPHDMADGQGLASVSTDVIERVVEALGLDKFSLVASSGGGAMAYWYALAMPNQVERIVQLGTPAGLDGSPIDTFTRILTIP